MTETLRYFHHDRKQHRNGAFSLGNFISQDDFAIHANYKYSLVCLESKTIAVHGLMAQGKTVKHRLRETLLCALGIQQSDVSLLTQWSKRSFCRGQYRKSCSPNDFEADKASTLSTSIMSSIAQVMHPVRISNAKQGMTEENRESSCLKIRLCPVFS